MSDLEMYNGEKCLSLWWHKSEVSDNIIRPFDKAYCGCVGVDIDGMRIMGWVTEEEYTFLLLTDKAS